MSQSPDKAVEIGRGHDYIASRKLLSRLLREGMSWSGHERNCCFLNTHGERFATISGISGLDFPDDGRAVATVDWDLDGDLDLWLVNRTAPRLRFMLNRTPSGNRFLAVRLVGSEVNHDAIGARVSVYLDGETAPLIRTSRAGEGFLAQSSKWIHFGLGDARAIEKLVVRWPGGRRETFSGLRPDNRYVLVEGRGTAEKWVLARPAVSLAPSRPHVPPATGQARVFLAAPVPAPSLQYVDFDGHPVAPAARPESAVLVNLWASWCQPCVHELSEFVQREEEIRASGLSILALSLDGLGAEPITQPSAARGLLDNLDFPFDSGVATTRLVETFQMLHDTLVSKPRPLPVPTSFLIDASGLLAAIYRGPVPVDRLLEDVAGLRASGDERFLMAIPFPGRRHRLGWPPFFEHIDRIADAYREGGQPRQALDLYRRVAEMKPDLARAQERLGTALMEAGQPEEAAVSFDRALSIDPDDPEARLGRARLLARMGRTREAVGEYRRVLAARPGDAAVHVDLGLCLAALGMTDEAIESYREALAVQADHVPALNNLAIAVAGQGRDEEAIGLYRRLLEVDPGNAIAHANLGLALSRLGRNEEAVAHLSEAVRLDPDFAEARDRLTRLLSGMGRNRGPGGVDRR